MDKTQIREQIQSEVMHRFAENLPRMTYAGNGKKISHHIAKSYAENYPYIKANGAVNHYIIFDVDHPDCYMPEQYNCPMPTIIVMDRYKLSNHSYYELDKPIPSQEHLSKASIKLLDFVKGCYKQILNADQIIIHQKMLSKNPLNPTWINHIGAKVFSLAELAEYIPNEIKTEYYRKDRHYQLDPLSRNCTLFDAGRYYAYDIVGGCISHEELYDKILIYVTELNNNNIPKFFNRKGKTKTREVKDITKSISGWTWKYRDCIHSKNKGIMLLDKSQPLEQRQSTGALYSHEKRKATTQDKITKAIEELKDKGIEKPTRTQIAETAKVSRKTVYNYISRTFEKDSPNTLF